MNNYYHSINYPPRSFNIGDKVLIRRYNKVRHRSTETDSRTSKGNVQLFNDDKSDTITHKLII